MKLEHPNNPFRYLNLWWDQQQLREQHQHLTLAPWPLLDSPLHEVYLVPHSEVHAQNFHFEMLQLGKKNMGIIQICISLQLEDKIIIMNAFFINKKDHC